LKKGLVFSEEVIGNSFYLIYLRELIILKKIISTTEGYHVFLFSFFSVGTVSIFGCGDGNEAGDFDCSTFALIAGAGEAVGVRVGVGDGNVLVPGFPLLCRLPLPGKCGFFICNIK
jgi:hypothetical protein